MKAFKTIGFACAAISLMIQGVHAEGDPNQTIIVSFKGETSRSAIEQNGGKVIKELDGIGAAIAEAPAGGIERIKKDARVKTVELEQETSLAPAPAKGKRRQSEVGSLRFESDAWDLLGVPYNDKYRYTGKEVKVAVIDTGVETKNSDLRIAGGASFIDGSLSFEDSDGHGTVVSEIIASQSKSPGNMGIAPNVQLYALKALDKKPDGTTRGTTAQLAMAIDWCVQNGIDIVNISAGSKNPSSALEEAIKRASQKGVLIVVAAGNEGASKTGESSVLYPARYDSVLAVGAVNSLKERASFSSVGKEVDISAPGTEVLGIFQNNTYHYQGTSFAAPAVAAVAALHKEIHPDWSAAQITEQLSKDSIDLGAPGKDGEYGYGLAQAPAKTKKIALLDEKTQLQLVGSLDIDKSAPAQEVTAYDQNAAGYKIKIGNQMFWTFSENIFDGEADAISKQIELSEGVQLREVPSDWAKSQTVPAQTARAFEAWSGKLDGQGDWLRVKAGEASGWIRKSELGPKKQVSVLAEAKLYGKPNESDALGASISPQKISVLEEKGEWYLIQTWLGNAWIKKANALKADEISKTNEEISLSSDTPLRKSPFESGAVEGLLAPQKVSAFESYGGWKHIRTWIGDMWVKA